jgi:CubicO group peptidase (beta-lactamase class C family)
MAIVKKRRVARIVLLLVLIGAIAFVFIRFQLPAQLRLGVGWKAQILCSGVFVSGREAAQVLKEDVSVIPILKLIGAKVDYEKKEVRASFLGLVKNRSIYHPQLGSILLSGASAESVRSWPVDLPEPQPAGPGSIPWPTGDLVVDNSPPPDGNENLLNQAMNEAFAESDPNNPGRTRAMLVLRDGRIVAERYAAGITADMPLIGWSMTKSVTSALVGILVGEGKLSLRDPAPVPEWEQPGDARRGITLEQLLWMSSGLNFSETYAEKPVSDVQFMLFTQADMDAYAAGMPLQAEPGTKWNYSTGETNIIAGIIRRAFTDEREYWAFPRRALFNRIGMRSAVFETDATGMYVGGAYLYASARDWARLGLLYLNDGVWEGERILPEGWVAYSTTPAPTAGDGGYGAQIWLNKGPQGKPELRPFPNLPQDLYYFQGYQGQFVAIIPSRRLVVVRLGMTTKGEWAFDKILEKILQAV